MDPEPIDGITGHAGSDVATRPPTGGAGPATGS